MPKFTQGDWTVKHGEIKCGNHYIAFLFEYTLEETKANGRLIAAAPEMYEELYEVLQLLKGKTSWEGDEFAWYAQDIAELLARIDGQNEN